MSWIWFEHGGVRHRFAVARSGPRVWIGWEGGARSFGPEEAEEGDEEIRSGEIRSPMTGRIVSVHVKEGESVAEGQVLIVLEAMKMEYRLAAPRSGTVGRVGCAEGDQVELGRTLVTLAGTPS